MSKYTTEVRFICETNADLDTSLGADNVDDIISASWQKIFNFNFPIFDEEYRSVLCQKILKEYYLYEICAETVGQWELWLNARLNKIMPYYNKLYLSEKFDFDPMTDVKYKRSGNKTNQGTDNENGTSGNTRKNTGTVTVVDNNTNWNYYSDTPQGSVEDLDSLDYLTNATKNTDDGGSTRTDDLTVTDSGTRSNNKTFNSTDDYTEDIAGKMGTSSYSKLLMEYRESLINIDAMIIEELKDLFFGLWNAGF